jgi:hypothetical protein
VRPDLLQQNVDSYATRLNKVFSVHTSFQSPGPPQSYHFKRAGEKVRLRLLFVIESIL